MPALRARSVMIKISHRTRRREIAGQRRPHRHHEPDAVPIGKPEHERLECQDCGNVADDVREHGSVGGENIGIVEMEALHPADYVRRRQQIAGERASHRDRARAAPEQYMSPDQPRSRSGMTRHSRIWS